MDTRSANPSTGWTPWGDRLLAALAIGLAIGLAGAWTLQYTSPGGNPNLVEVLSYPLVDPTWMPPGVTQPYPLWGVHYFGDMWYHIGFGEAQSPYIIAGRPAQYPPVAIYIFKLWGVFGYPAALAIMSILNVGLLSLFAWKLTAPTPRSRRVLIITMTILITTPMIVTLDRGGHQYIALGALAWALWLYKGGRHTWAVLLTVVAISLKSYFVFFLLYPLLRGHKRFALETAVLTLAINAILFLSFPGRPSVSFAGFFVSSSQFSNAANFINIYDGTSLTSLVFHLTALTRGDDAATTLFFDFEPFLSVPGLIWLIVVAVLVASRKVPFWASLTFALLTAALAIPSAWPYNYASLSLAALYFGLGTHDPFPMRPRNWLDRIDRSQVLEGAGSTTRTAFLRWITLIAIVVSLTPQFFTLYGPGDVAISSYYLFTPLVTALMGLLALIWLAIPARKPQPAPALPDSDQQKTPPSQ